MKLEERKYSPLSRADASSYSPADSGGEAAGMGGGGCFPKNRVSPFAQPGFVYRRELSRRGIYLNNRGSLGGGGGRFQSPERQAWRGRGLCPSCVLREAPTPDPAPLALTSDSFSLPTSHMVSPHNLQLSIQPSVFLPFHFPSLPVNPNGP